MARRHFLRSAGLTAFAAATVASATFLTACSSDTDEAAPEADSITVSQPWIKAVDDPAATGHMTSAFGTLENSSDHDIRLVSASSGAAGTIELHEVVESGGNTTMREKEGGFVVPADGSVELTPGGEHFMLMDVQNPIRSGDAVTITARFSDGSTITVDALARDFAGNEENYSPAGH